MKTPSFSTLIPATALLLGLCASPALAAAGGGSYQFGGIRKMDVELTPTPSEWSAANDTALRHVSGGHSALGKESGQPVSLDTVGTVFYHFPAASVGMALSEQLRDYVIGETCDYLPVDDPSQIDWTATAAALEQGPARDGYVMFTGSTNALERILFTRDGTFAIEWKLLDGTSVTRTYTIGLNTKDRPHRLFWTEHPYNAPHIDLTGKFIRLFGNPGLIVPEYVSTTAAGVSNVVNGVYYDITSHTLAAYAKSESAGPRGQFVLAYYDSGNYNTLVTTVVVEVGPPDPSTLHASVGFELRPVGGGYTIDGLKAYIQKGIDASSAANPYSPYLYQHTGQHYYSQKNGAVFAIVPTDGSTDGGSAVPWNADIYWEAPDRMNTLWPFEEDWYQISWASDTPIMVIGAAGAPGIGSFIPSDYTAEICEYSAPAAGLAKVTDNVLTASSAGYFTLKLSTATNVWFVPLRSVLNTESSVFDQTARECFIGNEITLRGGVAAGSSADLAELIDSKLSGYLYAAGSLGRNWNPRLYHDPSAATTNTVSAGVATDPFAALESSIYAVNDSTNPIEVWWYRSLLQNDMPAAIRIPSLPQRYKAVWPSAEDAPEIVLASQLGSKGVSYACDGRSAYFAKNDASGSVDGVRLDVSAGNTVSFWMDLSPGAASGLAALAAGGILSVPTADGGSFVAYLSSVSETGGTLSFRSTSLEAETDTPTTVELAVPTNDWHFVSLAFSEPIVTNFTGKATITASVVRVYCDLNLAGQLLVPALHPNSVVRVGSFPLSNDFPLVSGGVIPAATGVAMDRIRVWNSWFDITNVVSSLDDNADFETKARLLLKVDFDDSSDLKVITGQTERYAIDSIGGRTMVFEDTLAMSPGSPSLIKGAFYTADNVAPEIYYQNSKTAIGYNPNEEHAFLWNNGTDYTAWALRNDLNMESSSRPFVLVQYASKGKGAMRCFSVVCTNRAYNTFFSSAIAANVINVPCPLSLLSHANNNKNFAIADGTGADDMPVYIDKNRQMWARRDGTFSHYAFYGVQDGFAFPSLSSSDAAKLTNGTLIGWMNCVNVSAPTLSQITDNTPLDWRWSVSWPDTNGIPTMRVGQTLTTAANHLPEVWSASSMGVAYPSRGLATNAAEVVRLIDPTVARTAGLAISQNFANEYGFTVGSSGTCFLRKGKYYLNGLPPTISDRFYIDTAATASQNMVLVGQYVEKAAGTSYLQINVLTDSERAALAAACKSSDAAAVARWKSAVTSLATNEVLPTTQTVARVERPHASAASHAACSYSPVDHYALIATGDGSGWATLIENDGPDTTMVPAGSPVSMHVIRVLPKLYAGPLVVLEDPNNKLSEQLNILYAAPFGDASDDFEFEWHKRAPSSDGVVPVPDASWNVHSLAAGLTDILLGGDGATLSELVNTYFAMRYRAKSGTPAAGTVGTGWSDWCGPTLAEGWVQRVLKNITPFAQRLSDFYEHAAELAISMPEQIGGPYEGDVALNNDNLESVGLIQLYQTVLNKAESLSLTLGINDPNANKQLMEAVTRLADLYMILGAEAYSDAENPTISLLSIEDGLPSSVYCFENQLPSLLDEELALLRGRSAAVAPNMTTSPYYNRLMWNFTTGVTEGEMAYVMNYNIKAENGVLTVEQAAKKFPQGHGDAYGHYLSAVSGYYRLLRNPSFSWGDPSMMEMLVADSIVNMDYEDEQKFADAAAKLAQISSEVVNRTACKQWRDEGATGNGYFDSNSEQAFGYGEWAVRGGLGAFYNWATAESLLPATTNEAVRYFSDASIATITRGTVPALSTLATSLRAVENTVNRVDAGLNPLGLSDNAVPFDIDPSKLASKNSHFEQILERANTAIANAETVLAYANKFGARARLLENSAADMAATYESTEASYNKSLIAIFGTPYSGDIGVSGTYAQGYEGPDLYHYMWMDLGPYGITNVTSADIVTNLTLYAYNGSYSNITTDLDTTTPITINYQISSGGLIVKPSSVTGTRLAEGSVQSAYRDFLSAYVKLSNAETTYKSKVSTLLNYEIPVAEERLSIAESLKGQTETMLTLNSIYLAEHFAASATLSTIDTVSKIADAANKTVVSSIPKIIGVGLTVNTDPSSLVAGVANGVKAGTVCSLQTLTKAIKLIDSGSETALKLAQNICSMVAAAQTYSSTKISIADRLRSAVVDVRTAAVAVQAAVGDLSAAEASFRTEVEKGELLLEERKTTRQHQANTATQMRYADMYDIVQHNSALSKYQASFDIAQKYVYLLARVYDYETGLLSSDSQSGDSFLKEIVATRALGEEGVSIVPSCSDGGLCDIVNRMTANWAVLKGRLGINNPIEATKWFSLRYSLFRIAPGAAGDAAWERKLRQYWVDDLRANSEFARYCQPPESEAAGSVAEPGLMIPFSTSINVAENFFGRPLAGGETTFSSSDYATKIYSAGVHFVGYNAATNGWAGTVALATAPNIYLVPVGDDKMRAPAGTQRKVLSFRVVNQVLPLPYTVGSAELDNEDWVATFNGLDGTSDSFATIRRHSTLPEGETTTSGRLVGRSAWNTRWILVIPGSSLLGDRAKGLETFIHGADLNGDGIADQRPVSDIQIGLKTYSRSGN